MHDLQEDQPGSGIDARGIKPPPAFAVERSEPVPGIVVLALHGELDLATSERFRANVAEELDREGPLAGVILDLGEASFMDSSMLREILRADAELRGRDTVLVLARPGVPLRRLLDLTRTAELLTLEASVEAAVARIREG